MQKANFLAINEKLKVKLEAQYPAKHVCNKNNIDAMANRLVQIISNVINEKVPISKPSPYAKCWWTKELTNLKKEKNQLSNLLYRLRGIPNAPIHTSHREAASCFSNKIKESKKKHWLNWLEEADSRDIYNANMYITNTPTNYSNARIPMLQSSMPDGSKVLASENSEKAKTLIKKFFPPPPINPCTPVSAYPEQSPRHILQKQHLQDSMETQTFQSTGSRWYTKHSHPKMHQNDTGSPLLPFQADIRIWHIPCLVVNHTHNSVTQAR